MSWMSKFSKRKSKTPDVTATRTPGSLLWAVCGCCSAKWDVSLDACSIDRCCVGDVSLFFPEPMGLDRGQ